jgi:cell division septum initiation protein DivIVA
MGGYDMSAVDDFLETLTDNYTSLFKENALLKNKIRVLMDKLEEYRSVDESMRKTWRDAQKNADEMIAQAKLDADNMLSDAQKRTETSIGELNRQLEVEEYRLGAARQQTITFVNSLREIYLRQIEQLAVIPTAEPPPPSVRQTMESAANMTAFEIERSVMAQIEGDYDKDATRILEKISDIAEPAKDPEPEPGPEVKVSVINTAEGGFYGPDGNALDDDVIRLLWDPEQDTEVPRPREDGFPDLEEQFGNKVEIVKKK